MVVTFASILLPQVCLGRPTFRFPCGFQSRACLVTFAAGFRSGLSIPTLVSGSLSLLGLASSFWPPDSQDVSKTFVGKCLELVGVGFGYPPSFCVIYCRRTDFTLVSKIHILLWSERAVDLQIGRRVLKACLCLFIRHLISLSVPPSLLTTLPRYTNLSTFLMSSWCSHTGSCCLLFTLMTSVFPMLICRPVFSASTATQHSFSCASCGLLERRLMSSAKTRSFSCFVKVHWMPVLLPAVDCLMTQSTIMQPAFTIRLTPSTNWLIY